MLLLMAALNRLGIAPALDRAPGEPAAVIMRSVNAQPPSATPRRGRPRDPRADVAILDAALELLAAHGYERMTLAQVARAAKVSTATLYRRYPDKTEQLEDYLEIFCNSTRRHSTLGMRSSAEHEQTHADEVKPIAVLGARSARGSRRRPLTRAALRPQLRTALIAMRVVRRSASSWWGAGVEHRRELIFVRDREIAV